MICMYGFLVKLNSGRKRTSHATKIWKERRTKDVESFIKLRHGQYWYETKEVERNA